MTSSAEAANYMSHCYLILTTLTAFLLVISQCCHGDEPVTLTTELKSLLLGLMAMVTIILCATSDLFQLLWRHFGKCGAMTTKTVSGFCVFVPSNHSRNTSVSCGQVQRPENSLLKKSRRTILRFCDRRKSTSSSQNTVS